MKKPKVSFVIRTKNEARFIGKVLKYLYKQTFQNFEVIIVDSGSTDKTLEIVKKFPVKVIKIKPKDFNFSYSLNLGISKAKGEIIGIISGHTIPISNNWLEGGLKNFKDKNVAGITGCSSENPFPYLWRVLGALDFISFDKRIEFTKRMTNTHALIRKNMWELYPFDEKLPGAEDYDWASEMIARGYNVIRDNKFRAFHSHIVLGRRPNVLRRKMWGEWVRAIDKRKRPRKSFSKVKI
ncbi:glycosyltransferase [Patescibacteria group bacterium]|nr:glycosyltransferase [Patescibacteria group bacterium]